MKNDNMIKTHEEVLLKTPVFDVVQKTFENNHEPIGFKPVGLNCHDWVMIIVLSRDKKMTVGVRQHRWGIERETLEFPCGTVEENEQPVDAAIREFKEETSIDIDNLKEIACFNPNAAYFNNTMHIFVGYADLPRQFGELSLDEFEDCEPFIAKVEEIMPYLQEHAMGWAAIGALMSNGIIKTR
ncbi:MAG: NUDIX hydrolase [Bacteroidales bacterium]|nr:NUDIX hydrolase [Bacteroidales bacterium]